MFDRADPVEFWEYMCFYDREYGRTDGLICFIKDFYTTASEHVDDWSDELMHISASLKENLLSMVDKLYYLSEAYAEHITPLENLLFQLDEAINAIPNLNLGVNQARGA